MQEPTQEQSGINDGNGHSQVWEREVLTRLAMSSLNEQRRARRWRIFFVLLTFAYIGLFFMIIASSNFGGKHSDGPHTAIVSIDGIIAAGAEANSDAINASLKAAFEDENTKGIILRVNSPGGSPVQSGNIYDEMVRLRNKHPNIPLYAVIEDIGASGGYYIAAGAEKIYADKASMVGSIGVRMDMFGFVDAISKLGIERRLLTAGKNKGLLDPFLPEDEAVKGHISKLLEQVHQQFIHAVKSQRGDRLVADEDLFSGLVWSGEKSVSLGLVDELGSVGYVAREVVGEDTLRDFTYREDLFTRISHDLGTSLMHTLESRLSPRLQ